VESFFVNDIIDNNGKITQEFILHKLKNKSNWISDIVRFVDGKPYNLSKNLMHDSFYHLSCIQVLYVSK
jgi:hypothetical protein